jgi:hypothetical protein
MDNSYNAAVDGHPDWEVHEHTNGAHRSTRGTSVDVDVFDDGSTVYVDIEQGSGYMGQRCSTTIPIEVLVRLLERVGFSVTRR